MPDLIAPGPALKPGLIPSLVLKFIPCIILSLWVPIAMADTTQSQPGTHPELAALFSDWRTFETPPLLEGAPDYREATFAAREPAFKALRERLDALDRTDWTLEQRIDWRLLWAEMNGYEFNQRALRPWQRDPAFYTSVWEHQSDTPAHEGPVHHAPVELWTYRFPLSESDAGKLTGELASIPPLLRQAPQNLTGDAGELWAAGIRNLEDQSKALKALAGSVDPQMTALQAAIAGALKATDDFVAWLQAEAPGRTGPSGIGIEDYNWQLKYVHLVPMTWEDEVRLLSRELDRALSSLALEEHNNRDLPPLVDIRDEAEFAQRTDAAVRQFADFLVKEQVLEPQPWIEPALRAQMGVFVPADQRNFFAIVSHYEPLALWTHWYHWFDLARMAAEPHPSPLRRGPMLYNIWDSRAEGMATGFEEMAMRAGLFDANPRARELVWVMLAQRAARGLGSLYAHANIFTLKQARDFHVAWTPRGWMREDLDLLGFEQLLYLRQPGYGTSYITGKYLIESLMGEMARAQGKDFKLADFFAVVDAAGLIPVSMIHWQLTGRNLMVPSEGPR